MYVFMQSGPYHCSGTRLIAADWGKSVAGSCIIFSLCEAAITFLTIFLLCLWKGLDDLAFTRMLVVSG
ncbi:Uncharacterized protein HZ326_4754 [Fusarium oxysporum f. sp. albedinis]|nr:Uncharacterized protein HZ326_4754 [Fusarium oxysporum f. sp. albedinis]